MPIYLYTNDQTGETKEILQSMKDKHEYFEDGVQWRRVYTIPTASIDTKIDPFSSNEFIRKTNKKGTMGEVMDLSAELSEKRAEKTGSGDPVKQKVFSDYEKKVGKKHLLDKPKVIENSKVKIEF
jgi:predicted nucleic acid-binding Zn ribbon protein